MHISLQLHMVGQDHHYKTGLFGNDIDSLTITAVVYAKPVRLLH